MFSSRPRPTECRARRGSFRPQIEALEDRSLPNATPAVVVLQPGASIQHAVNNATPGTFIYLEAGTYNQSVTVNTPGIHLIGLPGPKGAPVVIANPGGVDDGITVTPGGSGFVLKNVVVSGFDEDGVLLTGVDGFLLSGVTAANDQDYGIFPVFSADGVIQSSVAYGSGDTGIYIGQSSNVQLRLNTAHDNLNGIEIENSTYVNATQNLVYGNTVGILVDLLPTTVEGIQVVSLSHNTVAGNIVLGNNRPNTALPPDITATEQSGVGIAVIGGDHTTVQGNLVIGNNTAGIVLASGLDLLALAGLPADSYGSVDPNPSHTLIKDNVVIGNGLNPADPTQPHADLIATADALAGTANHWVHNVFLTSIPAQLP
jgi:parallel beta-helix repeat protein